MGWGRSEYERRERISALIGMPPRPEEAEGVPAVEVGEGILFVWGYTFFLRNKYRSLGRPAMASRHRCHWHTKGCGRCFV